MNNDVAQAFVASSLQQIEHARSRINHCFDQLDTEDVWWAPRDGCNPIGVIIQHLMGNLRQWAVSGIGGEADVRDRPSEFRVGHKNVKREPQTEFNRLLDQVAQVYSRAGATELLAARRIQGFDTTGLAAMYATMCHLELHTGQVLYLTRLRLGERYRESWTPASKEQGA